MPIALLFIFSQKSSKFVERVIDNVIILNGAMFKLESNYEYVLII